MTMPVFPGWTIEHMHEEFVQGMREDRVLFDSETEHQRLRLFENARFGRVLTLDGVVQTTEVDEFIYHEMIAHVPILAHGAVRRVLIIGGGDGGTAREVLRHPGIDHVTMVEIDAGVIEFSRTYLPSLSDGAFDDPRLEVEIADGVAFVAETTQRFDLVLVDSTDPDGPGEGLFTRAFYENARACLAPGGILITQNGVPFVMPEALSAPMSILRDLFNGWGCYLAAVPSYSGGPMVFGWGAENADAMIPALGVLEDRFRAAGLATRYYSPAVHRAAFALPGYVQAMMPGDAQPTSGLRAPRSPSSG